MPKLPAFQFYPSDWLSDLNLQACSLSAHGLLINLMCLMHQGTKYGHLMTNGRKMKSQVVSKILRLNKKVYKKYLTELVQNNVLKISDEGVVYCPRMVKDQQLRNLRKKCGQLGGNPDLLNQNVNQDVNTQVNPLVQNVHNQKPTPSSSSSSSRKKEKYKKERKGFYPNWLDQNLWIDFIKYRKTIKAPLTERAEKILLTELAKLINGNQGNQKDIIEQTIASGKWKGFYPIKNQTTSQIPKPYVPPKVPKENERVSSKEIRTFRRSIRLVKKSTVPKKDK